MVEPKSIALHKSVITVISGNIEFWTFGIKVLAALLSGTAYMKHPLASWQISQNTYSCGRTLPCRFFHWVIYSISTVVFGSPIAIGFCNKSIAQTVFLLIKLTKCIISYAHNNKWIELYIYMEVNTFVATKLLNIKKKKNDWNFLLIHFWRRFDHHCGHHQVYREI